MVGFLEWLADHWVLVAGVITAFLTWHKEWIFRKFNIRKGQAEATQAEKGVDTVYISNSEKLVEIYGKSMDDLLKRNEATIEAIKQQYELDLSSLKDSFEEERQKDRVRDAEREQRLIKAIASEESLGRTVKELKTQVTKLTTEVKKLTNQLNYYRKHSDVNLPDELQ